MGADPIHALSASFLTPGVRPSWPAGADVHAFLESAAGDGILGLLYARVYASGAAAEFPSTLVAALRSAAHRQAGTEMAQRLELQRIAAALRAGGVDAILMKGSALAYDVYADPSWRVRSDVDLLIRPDDRARTREALRDLGYASFSAVSGALIVSQFHCERREGGVRHLCDVHWRIVNRLRLANAVRFDDLAADAIALPALGPGGRGLGHVHALWLACVHRAVHHYDQETLIWLYDVHLLCGTLDADGWSRFMALAERSKTRRICLRALQLTTERLGTAIPASVTAALDAAPADEPSSIYLNARMRQLDFVRDDLRALPDLRSRLALVKEHVFPAAAYMREGYAADSSSPLAWLYLRRIARGAIKWMLPLRP